MVAENNTPLGSTARWAHLPPSDGQAELVARYDGRTYPGPDSNAARAHTIGLTPGGADGEWATYCVECSEGAEEWVQTCDVWLDRPPRQLVAAPDGGK